MLLTKLRQTFAVSGRSGNRTSMFDDADDIQLPRSFPSRLIDFVFKTVTVVNILFDRNV